MTDIVIIAAIAENNVIGNNGDMPWSIKEDFLRFKALTMGHPCIMGDRTYDSLPDFSRPLPGRENIVCTLDHSYSADGATIFHDFYAAVDAVKAGGAARAFITGGASIYRLGLDVATTLELTHIHRAFVGDVEFPPIDFKQWKCVAEEERAGKERTSGETVSFSFKTYERI